MPFVAVPATVKASFFYTLNGQPAMNRIHIGVPPSLPSEGLCEDTAVAMFNWWDGNAKASVGLGMSLREINVQSIAEQNGPQSTFSAGLPLAGTHSSPMMPGNVAFAVSLRTGLTGRSARGRWYWCGLTEDQVTDNELISGAVTTIVGAIDNLLSAIIALGFTPVIVSYQSGGGPRVGGPVKFIINDALAVDAVVDSQRGRLH